MYMFGYFYKMTDSHSLINIRSIMLLTGISDIPKVEYIHLKEAVKARID